MSQRDHAAPSILLGDADRFAAGSLKAYLESRGFRIAIVDDGSKVLAAYRTVRPDLLILNARMPSIDGWSILAQLREQSWVPVILIVPHDSDTERLLGLRLGADDCIFRPIDHAVVMARAVAILRRTAGDPTLDSVQVIGNSALEIDVAERRIEVLVGRRRVCVELTVTEFQLFMRMADMPGHAFRREELVASLDIEAPSTRMIDACVCRLRKKLAMAGLQTSILTVRGIGYAWSGPSSTAKASDSTSLR